MMLTLYVALGVVLGGLVLIFLPLVLRVVGILLVVAVAIGIVLFVRAQLREDSPRELPHVAVAKSLPELFAGKPYVVIMDGGEAEFVSAIPTSEQAYRVTVTLRYDSEEEMVRADIVDALKRLRPAFCWNGRLLSRFSLKPEDIQLVVYKRSVRVGQVTLPATYCTKPGG